ncbi:hypothetical protein [Hydrogenimonas sp.]
MNGALDRLRDIKPPVEVPDHSPIFLILLILLLLAGVGAIYLFVRRGKRGKRRRRPDPKEIARRKLETIDFGNPKEAVYTFGEYLPLLMEDESLTERFERIAKELEKYKYRKEVPPLDDSDVKNMRKLIAKVLKNG